MKPQHLITAVATVALASSTLLAPATAAENEPAAPTPEVLVEDLLSPLSLAVADDGTVFYSQNFAGALFSKRPGKEPALVHQAAEGAESGAVSEDDGTLRFAITLAEGAGAKLKGVGKGGNVRTLANLGEFEESRNPDAGVTYGFRSLPAGCEVPEGFPYSYSGIVESHPFATLQSDGRTYIADAAGNSIVKFGRNGGLSTVAVLPAVPVEVTEGMAEGLELPPCTIGATYYFEPVPTDVEEGPDGRLYVTTLPGGPEDGSTGAQAAVTRVNPETGATQQVASGLISAVGLAVTKRGDIFVSELFGGRIAKIPAGGDPTTYLETALPGDLELKGGDLYGTRNVLPPASAPPAGQVFRIRR